MKLTKNNKKKTLKHNKGGEKSPNKSNPEINPEWRKHAQSRVTKHV